MVTKIKIMSNHIFEKECKQLRDSLQNLNTLIQALADRNQHERKQIRETYKAMYGEEFLLVEKVGMENKQRIKEENGVFEALSMWMLDSHDRDAIIARKAIRQELTNYKALVEIFVGRRSSQIFLMKQAYQAKFRRQLDQDIISIEPPHAFQRILVALAASHKAHHEDVSQHIAKGDARRLYQTGEGSSGSIEEALVLEIFSKRSIQQLNLTFSCYKHIYGHDYSKSLKKANNGEFESALRIVIKCICNPPYYYAKVLKTSIKGELTDKEALERVIVSRAEVDVDEIQMVLKKKYGIELKDAICEGISSGDYKDFLTTLATKKHSK